MRSHGAVHTHRDVGLDVGHGVTVAPAGDIGAGKSTPVKLTSPAIEPTSGEMEFYATPVSLGSTTAACTLIPVSVAIMLAGWHRFVETLHDLTTRGDLTDPGTRKASALPGEGVAGPFDRRHGRARRLAETWRIRPTGSRRG